MRDLDPLEKMVRKKATIFEAFHITPVIQTYVNHRFKRLLSGDQWDVLHVVNELWKDEHLGLNEKLFYIFVLGQFHQSDKMDRAKSKTRLGAMIQALRDFNKKNVRK